MTKEEVAASLERMEDDPDEWYVKGLRQRITALLTIISQGTRESSAPAVQVSIKVLRKSVPQVIRLTTMTKRSN